GYNDIIMVFIGSFFATKHNLFALSINPIYKFVH
ncbi:uncharacterized protein METZ01_LOCUS24938, partial [marine metagenome]